MNSTFRGCSAYGKAFDKRGGAVSAVGSVAGTRISESLFEDCYAIFEGGAVFASSTTLISRSTFRRCKSNTTMGGGVHVDMGETTIEDSRFEDCEASQGGAVSAIWAEITNSTFLSCKATGSGGGLWVTTQLNISASYFELCDALELGGAAASPSVVTSQSKFKRCTSKFMGGAVWSNSSIVTSSKFEDCSSQKGGAVFTDLSTITNVTFIRCKAVGGGALQLAYGGFSEITGSLFEGCEAEDGGAALSSGSLVVEQSKFYRCSAGGFGGAIAANGAVHLKTCEFYQCSSLAGGAVRAFNLTSERSVVQHSASKTIGGGFLVSLELTSTHDVFESNRASFAGAVWCLTASVKGAEFTRNKANGSASAIHIDSSAIFIDSIFVANSAMDGSGAAQAVGAVEMLNVIFADNRASYGGGLKANSVKGSNVTFINNTAVIKGGALMTEYFDLSDTQFIGNIASQGSAVYFTTTIHSSQMRTTGPDKNSSVLLHISQQFIVSTVFDCENDSAISIHFSNTKFLRNIGGTLLERSINVTFEECHFEGNILLNDMIKCKEGEHCSVSISHSTIQQHEGSIIRARNMSMIISGSQLYQSNSRTTRALFETLSRSTISLSTTSFTGNTLLFDLNNTIFNASSIVVESNVRNFVLRGSNATFRDCYCRNNGANIENGTCITAIDTQVVVWNFTASDNVAKFGGDIFVEGASSLHLLSSRFIRSRAYIGGSIWATSNMTLENCVFEATVTEQQGALPVDDPYVLVAKSPGGAIAFMSNGNKLRMSHCNILQCSGGYGVLALIGVADIELVNVTFTNNTALYGGVFAMSAPTTSHVSISGGVISNNNATFGGVVFATPNIQVSSNAEYSGNNAFYGDITYLRCTTVSISVSTYESGQAVPMKEGLFHVGVGIGVLISFVLLNERNERVMLGRSFTAKLEDVRPSANTRFDPSLDSLSGTIHPDGTVLFPNMTVTGDPGIVVHMVLKSELLMHSAYNFTVKLDGCPKLYGVAPFGSRGKACVLCELGQYSYGGNSKCNPCGANMVCERLSLPVSMKGYWMTPVTNSIVKAVECPEEKLCLGGNQCDVGYNVSSYVCGQCTAGKYHWYGKCVPCRPNKTLLFLAGILVLVIVNLYALFIQQTALPSPTASLKILLQYSQVALLVVPRIPPSASAAEMPVRFMSADMSWASLLPCFIRIEPSMFFHGAGILSGMAVIVFVLHRVALMKWRKRKGVRSTATTTYNSIISLLFVSAFSTTSSLFDFLSCVEVFEGQMVVTKSPSIVCSGERYRFHRALVAMYCGVAWAALALMLVKIIVDYNKAPSKTTALWTFMFYHFEDEYPQRAAYLTDWQFKRARLRSHFCRWWQCVMLVRRVTILGVYVVVKRYKIDSIVAFPLVLVGFLYLHVMVNPYKSYFDDLTDGIGILLLLTASLLSHNLTLCYAIALSGSIVLAGYTLFDMIYRYLSAYRNRKARERQSRIEVNGDATGIPEEDTSETDGSWSRYYQYTDSLADSREFVDEVSKISDVWEPQNPKVESVIHTK